MSKFLKTRRFLLARKAAQCHSGELSILFCKGKKTNKLKSCFDPLTMTSSVSFQKTESSSSACSTSSSQRTMCGASSSPSAVSRNAPSSEVLTATAKVSLCSCLPPRLGRGCCPPPLFSPSNFGDFSKVLLQKCSASAAKSGLFCPSPETAAAQTRRVSCASPRQNVTQHFAPRDEKHKPLTHTRELY